jgi:hypothetical protein
MPTVSMFYGIVVTMYPLDHNPPHFHALYAEHEAIIAIQTRNVLAGRLPAKQQAIVMDWAARHEEELMENWNILQIPLPPMRLSF